MIKTKQVRPLDEPVIAFTNKLLVFSLASCFRLLLALYAGLLIVFSLAKLGKDAGTSHCTLKATKCAVQGLAFFNFNFCHFSVSLPPLIARDFFRQLKSNNIIHYNKRFVKSFFKVYCHITIFKCK